MAVWLNIVNSYLQILCYRNCKIIDIMTWFGSQGIVTTLWAGRSEVQFPIGARDFTPLKNVQTSSGANPAFSSVGTVVLYGIKQPGHKADCPPSSSAKVKYEWKNKSTSASAFVACTGTTT
jgi:hypothetical protein